MIEFLKNWQIAINYSPEYLKRDILNAFYTKLFTIYRNHLLDYYIRDGYAVRVYYIKSGVSVEVKTDINHNIELEYYHF